MENNKVLTIAKIAILLAICIFGMTLQIGNLKKSDNNFWTDLISEVNSSSDTE